VPWDSDALRIHATAYAQTLWVMPPRQMRLRTTFILLTLLSCAAKQSGETKKPDIIENKIDVPTTWKTLDFNEFTIQVPPTWEQVRIKGIDSYVGILALDNGDTASFDLGWYSNPLDEESIFVHGSDVHLVDEKGNLTFYGKADTIDIERLKKNEIKWTTIDGKRAKIVQPKLTRKGMTGVYFDSLWTKGSGTDRFQMTGINLNSENERQLLIAFETLKFKE
jgi:hypothetical protein